MQFKTYSFRYGENIIVDFELFGAQWGEIKSIIDGITDEDIINKFETNNRRAKSISESINHLLKERFIEKQWHSESPIFADESYQCTNGRGIWRLDFAKDAVAIEVAFNHQGDIAWNLIKPVLSSELNHVEKAIQTKIGIIITATESLKNAGGFDSAIGTYEKYIKYLKPLNNILTTPLIIIGLEPPRTFYIEKYQENRNTYGRVKRIEG